MNQGVVEHVIVTPKKGRNFVLVMWFIVEICHWFGRSCVFFVGLGLAIRAGGWLSHARRSWINQDIAWYGSSLAKRFSEIG